MSYSGFLQAILVKASAANAKWNVVASSANADRYNYTITIAAWQTGIQYKTVEKKSPATWVTGPY